MNLVSDAPHTYPLAMLPYASYALGPTDLLMHDQSKVASKYMHVLCKLVFTSAATRLSGCRGAGNSFI